LKINKWFFNTCKTNGFRGYYTKTPKDAQHSQNVADENVNSIWYRIKIQRLMAMKTKLILFVMLFAVADTCFGQEEPSWGNWNRLIGKWVGEGSGVPGQGGGTFSFSYDLDETIIVRKSRSEYPSSDHTTTLIHEDLMIIYRDLNGKPTRAIYFDNESHTIEYDILYSDNSIVLLSDPVGSVPVFKLTYTLSDHETLHTTFEISQDGRTYITYIEGNSIKTN
jgi:hypothetical protein